jgi:hypothetical protein
MTLDFAKIDYAKFWAKQRYHHERYKRRVESMPRKLPCQACHGMGGEIEPVLDTGEGPWEECGWCEGTGLLTPWLRGLWLREQRPRKAAA